LLSGFILQIKQHNPGLGVKKTLLKNGIQPLLRRPDKLAVDVGLGKIISAVLS
jgi:hypothetical protein